MKRQQGSVLIITVIVLFAATIISLYAMRGTIIQDKMTANINNKVITTNTAEEGATQFLNWARDHFKNTGAGWPTTETDQKTVWRGKITDNLMPYTNPENGVDADNVQNGRYYWINPKSTIAGCSTVETNPCWDNDNHQVTVQITGNLIKGMGKDTKILGESVYQIKITGPGALRLPELPAAITLGGPVNSFGAANSHNFEVQGGGKPAIATMDDPSYSKTVVDAINANNSSGKVSPAYSGGNCTGVPCVANLDIGIWGRPNDLMAYIDSIKNDPSVKYYSKTDKPVVSDADLNSNTFPITIVEGNYEQSGNMPNYKGVLIVLGANNSKIKGGGGSNFIGAMYFANITGSVGNYEFGNVILNTNGAHMTISYDSTYMSDSNNSAGISNKTTVLAWSEVCINHPSCT